ncbi:uncharacterized protein LOC113310879 isoform X2 [Papaver somniferum]|uniref:uncharacterized protein LOC113310879 isoform X2 n=1 Tax=Papaver somniferum TaxID=3469 RepID=UPI000E6FF3C5|nr:uncharacterized protein LOC113310879 isoform X2 [Papaver somniferum]
MEGSGAPDSPFRCIIVPRSRLLLEIPALPEILVLENPEQLQTCFQEFLDDYTRARQNKSSDPRKFADCEGNLIRVLSRFRTFKFEFPEFYSPVLKLPAIQSMISLLEDDECGSLLASYILITFEKLTDPDILIYDQHEEATVFVKSLVKSEALNVFVSTLDKFPGYDDVYFPALQTIAQMIFLHPYVADTAGKHTHLMEWVFKALGAPEWDELKQYVVGLLDTLLMSSKENRLQFGKSGAVTLVVNALTSLESPNEEQEEAPLDYEDEEYLVETLFSCLLFLLECPENIVSFVDAEGVELMIKFIQQEEFGYCYGSAIEALDIAVKVCQSASEKFVKHALAWNTAFPPSMDKIPPSVTHVKEKTEARHISLIASLTGGIAKTEKGILLKKFEEDDFERITWLMELYRGYSEEVEAMANRLEDEEYELCMEKLRYESTVQSIAVILGYLLSEDPTTRNKIENRLTHHNLKKKHVQDFILVYRDSIGNAGESVESAETVMVESTDSLEENSKQGMELDVKENPEKRMELDVKESAKTVMEESTGNAGESAESAKTVMEESTDSLEENSKQGMELDVKENPDKRMELDVKESAKTVMEESTGNAGESVESAKTVMGESTDSLEENPDKRMVLDVKYQTRQSFQLSKHTGTLHQ